MIQLLDDIVRFQDLLTPDNIKQFIAGLPLPKVAYSLLFSAICAIVWYHRKHPVIEMRKSALATASVLILHVYLFIIFLAYGLNGHISCDTGFLAEPRKVAIPCAQLNIFADTDRLGSDGGQTVSVAIEIMGGVIPIDAAAGDKPLPHIGLDVAVVIPVRTLMEDVDDEQPNQAALMATTMTEVVVRQLVLNGFDVHHPLLDLQHYLQYPATLAWNNDEVFTSGLKALREVVLRKRVTMTLKECFILLSEGYDKYYFLWLIRRI